MAFELRRAELVADGADGSDDAVVQSFVDDLAPGGLLTEYLSACQLAWRAGHTLLVHGGIAAEALTVVPGHAPTALDALDVDEWLARLNAFYAEQLAAFGDADNNPTLPARDVVDALRARGVRRVVVGHTPNGDVASVVRSTRVPFEIVIADNSRSRVDGACRVTVTDAAISLSGRVLLDDEGLHSVDATLPLDDLHTPLGKRTADGSLVKAPLHGDPRTFHTFRYLPGYEFTQRAAPAATLGPLAEAAPHALDDDDGTR
jgi:hypothetical protein